MLQHARPIASGISNLIAAKGTHVKRTYDAAVDIRCCCTTNGTLRCAPHGKQETESSKDAERARNSQQHEREGAMKVDPHAAVFVQAAPTCDHGWISSDW